MSRDKEEFSTVFTTQLSCCLAQYSVNLLSHAHDPTAEVAGEADIKAHLI